MFTPRIRVALLPALLRGTEEFLREADSCGSRGATTILLETDAGPEGVLLTETGQDTIVRDPRAGIECQIPQPVPFSSHIPQILISFSLK